MSDEKVLRLFGSNVAKLRRELGWTPAELGERAGLSEEKIGQFERGEASASYEDLRLIGGALSVPLSKLFEIPEQDYLAEVSGPDEAPQ